MDLGISNIHWTATKRVLIVVPNLPMLALGRKLSAKLGIELLCCDNAAQAINILKHERIDLVAPEAFMENGDLFKFITQVRALPKYLHTPLWVVARSPGPQGAQVANHVGRAALLFGADYFTVAYYSDVPKLIDQIQAAIYTHDLAS